MTASAVTLEPGLWSLNSFGEVLVATILNGKTFTWNAGVASPTSNRASTTTSGFETTNNPTATRTTLISPTTRHLIHFGTETTIGDQQHKMICLLDSLPMKVLMSILLKQLIQLVHKDFKTERGSLERWLQKKIF